MNYLQVNQVIAISDSQYLLKNTNAGLGILCYFFGNVDFTGDVYFYKTLDVHSGIEKVFGLTSLHNYKQFLYLLDQTKKVSTRILAEFSELSHGEKLQVLAGSKKIKGLAATGLTQLQGKVLIDENVLSIEEYSSIRDYLCRVNNDVKKIDSFLSEKGIQLKGLTQTQILNDYLKYNV